MLAIVIGHSLVRLSKGTSLNWEVSRTDAFTAYKIETKKGLYRFKVYEALDPSPDHKAFVCFRRDVKNKYRLDDYSFIPRTELNNKTTIDQLPTSDAIHIITMGGGFYIRFSGVFAVFTEVQIQPLTVVFIKDGETVFTISRKDFPDMVPSLKSRLLILGRPEAITYRHNDYVSCPDL